MAEAGEISYWHLPEAVQDIFLRQRSGILRMRRGDQRERLYFLSGQLFLLPDTPFVERLTDILIGPSETEGMDFDAAAYLRRELGQLVRELVDEMASWDPSEIRFEEGEAESEESVGPVPTGILVMDLCSRGMSEMELLRRLGGLDARFRSTDVSLRRRVPDLDKAEVGLLDRLNSMADVRTLIAESGRASEVLCNLTRLTAVRLVEAEDEQSSPGDVLSQELFESISARVLSSLGSRPLEIDPAAHRAQLSRVLQEYGRQSHFELLGVDSGSTVEDIHRRYMELARAYHPSHIESLGFRNRKRGGQVEWLFSRLTEAYLVLSDPERAAEYRRGLSDVPVPGQSDTAARERRTERREVARHNYRMALEHIEQEDYHYAIELLRQAISSDPLAEYHALLGQCLRRNPRWLHMAVDSYRQAAVLRPGDPDLRATLREVTEEYHRYAGDMEQGEAASEDNPEASPRGSWISKLRRNDPSES
jgi:curved DNA-binding protein CbpA